MSLSVDPLFVNTELGIDVVVAEVELELTAMYLVPQLHVRECASTIERLLLTHGKSETRDCIDCFGR